MKRLLRRIRGVIGTGITWAIGWGAAYWGISGIFGFGYSDLGIAAINGMIFGFIGGSVFGVLLSITERRRTLAQLSLMRIALWGGIGGASLLLCAAPLLFGSVIVIGDLMTQYLIPLGLNAFLGAGSAAGYVALARRGEEHLIEGEDDSLRRLELDGLEESPHALLG